jgi:hypothetical protein
MKNKWLLITIIVLLISVCFTYVGCSNVIGEPVNYVPAIENIATPTPTPTTTPTLTSSSSTNSSLDVITDNQTVLTIISANITTDNQTIILRNPTFEEMKDFILKDSTNHHEYIVNKYECRHFATDVDNNAKAAGWRCGFALLCYAQGQHSVVAFITIDRGLIFIEPQTDMAIDAKVGGTYQGQEILEILIAW